MGPNTKVHIRLGERNTTRFIYKMNIVGMIICGFNKEIYIYIYF